MMARRSREAAGAARRRRPLCVPEVGRVLRFDDIEGRRTAWGRPVDVLVMPEGSLLVSDDRAGAVYRIVSAGR